MKLCLTSDWHGHLPAVPECDLLLIAGDALPNRFQIRQHEHAFQRDWWASTFLPHLEAQPCRSWTMTPGNHDWLFETYAAPKHPNVLIDRECACQGLRIWGTPWTPWFLDWAFNAPRGASEEWLDQKWAEVPDGIDIVISHGPPAGPLGLTSRGAQAGSDALLKMIDRVRPRLVVCGHIHESFGELQVGPTTIVNASLVDEDYRPVNPIITFQWEQPAIYR